MTPSSQTSQPPSAQILLVEDNRSQAMMMERMLQEGGAEFELVHVETLREAKRHLETSRVACILLDLTLPDADRLDGLTEIKNVAPEAPVVVVTADNDAGRGIKAVQSGAQDYLMKGQMDSAQLCRSVRFAIERGRSEQQLAHRALHDVLTGLPNRLLFLDRLGRSIGRSALSAEPDRQAHRAGSGCGSAQCRGVLRAWHE